MQDRGLVSVAYFFGIPPSTNGANSVSVFGSTFTRLGRRFPVAVLTTQPVIAISSRAGAQILAPGTYETTFNFSVQVVATTTSIQIRGYDAIGPGRAVDYSAPAASDIIDGSYKFFSNVTNAHLSAGDVFIFIQAASLAGTENVTWIHSEVSIVRIGAAK